MPTTPSSGSRAARKQKGAFIFRPSEIERLENLDDHFYPSFDVHQASDLRKLMGSSHHFRATFLSFAASCQDALTCPQGTELK